MEIVDVKQKIVSIKDTLFTIDELEDAIEMFKSAVNYPAFINEVIDEEFINVSLIPESKYSEIIDKFSELRKEKIENLEEWDIAGEAIYSVLGAENIEAGKYTKQ